MFSSLSELTIQKIGRIDQLVRNFFEDNELITEVPARELMDLFVQKEIFHSNYNEGAPIRTLLREMEKDNRLHLMKHAALVRTKDSSTWYFIRKVERVRYLRSKK